MFLRGFKGSSWTDMVRQLLSRRKAICHWIRRRHDQALEVLQYSIRTLAVAERIVAKLINSKQRFGNDTLFLKVQQHVCHEQLIECDQHNTFIGKPLPSPLNENSSFCNTHYITPRHASLSLSHTHTNTQGGVHHSRVCFSSIGFHFMYILCLFL